MINPDDLTELSVYRDFESLINLRCRTEYGQLVVPNKNQIEPIHRWFKYKESFSSNLLNKVFGETNLYDKYARPVRVLDPFCGVGTTLVAAQSHDRNVFAAGIECNPLPFFVSDAKISSNQIDPHVLRSLARKIPSIEVDYVGQVPQLSSIKTGRCISLHMARKVVRYRKAIEDLDQVSEKKGLLVALASVIEAVSRVRKDGRALRIVERPSARIEPLFIQKCDEIADDIEFRNLAVKSNNAAVAYLGDGRNLSVLNEEFKDFDLILTSPPYPNNIDYNEVYKLEMWLMGFVDNTKEFLRLRRSTYRSHPTCDSHFSTFDESADSQSTLPPEIGELMAPVFARVSELDAQQSRGRMKVLHGYIHDTWISLNRHFSALLPGGWAVYVVGNSLHGGLKSPYLLPTDLIFACLGRCAGFEVREVSVARGLRRRLGGNHFLRDSVVFLRRPC